MDGPEEDSSSPIPIPKGSYNLNFDDFDENTNPFQSKSKISNSPPKNDTLVNPFASKCKLGSSPVENNNVINKEVEDVRPDSVTETPSSRGIKKPRSPDESCTNGPENDDQQTSGVMDTADTSPETEQVKEPPKTKKTTGAKTAVKKGIKKPKKFKPPANFGFQGGNDGDDIKIFAPQSQQTSSFPENSEVSTGNAPVNDITSDDHRTQTAKENDFLESHDVQGSNHMTQSLEMVHDFGAGEMPEEENEGFAPAHEAFEDSAAWEMLDKYGSEVKCDPDQEQDSLYAKFDPLYEEHQGRGNTQHEDHLADQSDDLLLMSTPPPSKPTSRVPKHPAARVLEGKVEEEDGSPAQSQVDKMLSVTPNKDKNLSSGDEIDEAQYYDAYDFPPSSKELWVTKNDSKLDMSKQNADNNIVQLVQDDNDATDQVLKYSQSDWNKMKQELELDFQARLLNKEREWSRKLGDRDKQISQLTESNKAFKQANEDMRMVVSDFEKTINQLQADKERVHSESQHSYEDVLKERDQAVEDLQGVEAAFSDLHRRYEKLKGVLEGFKKNEEVLKKCIQDYQGKLKKSEEKLQNIKQQAEEKLDQANLEIQNIRKTTTAEMARLEAAARKSDLQVQSLQKSLEQKIQENKELTSICDELIAKVGVD